MVFVRRKSIIATWIFCALFAVISNAFAQELEKPLDNEAENKKTSTAPQLIAELNESIQTIDVTVKDYYRREITGKVVITQFKPNGDGPFPLVLLNHGRSATNRSTPERFRYIPQAQFFVKRGFVVLVPTVSVMVPWVTARSRV